LIQILIEKKIKLVIVEEATIVSIRMEENEEIEGNNIEQFNETLKYLKKLFNVLNTHLLTRVMKVQTLNEKY
jgi:hypothetical protein